LEPGHYIKVKVGENKKNIRPPSTYLFGAEEEKTWPEFVVGSHR
jgi:hypothetical protein